MSKRYTAQMRMLDWCTRHKDNAAVLAWLAQNPPPPEWQGSAMEYAYTEMAGGPK